MESSPLVLKDDNASVYIVDSSQVVWDASLSKVKNDWLKSLSSKSESNSSSSMRERESAVSKVLDPTEADEGENLPFDRSLFPMAMDLLPPPATAEAAAAACAFFLNLLFCLKTFSSSDPRGNTSSPMRTTASPEGSTPYRSRKRVRSIALGGRSSWNMDRGVPVYTREGEEGVDSPAEAAAGEDDCCFRENMRLTMLFFLVFPDVAAALASFFDSLLLFAPLAKPSAVNSINGNGYWPFSNILSFPSNAPIKPARLDNGKSICLRLPSSVSSPLITRSAKPTGMANVGAAGDGSILPSNSGDDTCCSPISSNTGVWPLSTLLAILDAVSKSGTSPNVTQNDLGAKVVDATGVDALSSCNTLLTKEEEGRNSASNAKELVRLTNCCCCILLVPAAVT
mmetsp:Transcript_25529/g.54930  ORF Transcript_25529/g.54930 Transcript_25529/m.54930 type:complete len:397 (-) Transcript_25529:858-2048(-)